MEPFKNEFSHPNALRIADALKRVYPAFPKSRFNRGLQEALELLELKQRMQLIADRIEACLPSHPPEVFSILVQTLATDEGDTDGLRGFLVWPLTEIVARRGLPHFEESMEALREMTQRFTAEFAIRPFLRADMDRTLERLHDWCDDPDPHVRRLVSEGSRPMLPWGGNLPQLLSPPHPTLKLLEKLYRDPSNYVRLSVANHLNDFSKHQPALVIETLSRWRKTGPDPVAFAKLSLRACRTLLKAGNSDALLFHGYGSAQGVQLEFFELGKSSVTLGDALGYRLIVRNNTSQPMKVMFDYAIHHFKANGQLRPKIFKGRIRQLAPDESWEIIGRHLMKPITTRVYHAGIHRFEPRLNGMAFGALEFELEISP